MADFRLPRTSSAGFSQSPTSVRNSDSQLGIRPFVKTVDANKGTDEEPLLGPTVTRTSSFPGKTRSAPTLSQADAVNDADTAVADASVLPVMQIHTLGLATQPTGAASAAGPRVPVAVLAEHLKDQYVENPFGLLGEIHDDHRLIELLEKHTSIRGKVTAAVQKSNFWLSKFPGIGFLSHVHKAVEKHRQGRSADQAAQIAGHEDNPLARILLHNLAIEKHRKGADKTIGAALSLAFTATDLLTPGLGGAVAGAAASALGSLPLAEPAALVIGETTAEVGKRIASRASRAAVHQFDAEQPSLAALAYRPPSTFERLKTAITGNDDQLSAYRLGDEHATRALILYLAAPMMTEAEMSHNMIDPRQEAARIAFKSLLGSPPEEDLRPGSAASKLDKADIFLLEQLSHAKGQSAPESEDSHPLIEQRHSDEEPVRFLKLALTLDKQLA